MPHVVSEPHSCPKLEWTGLNLFLSKAMAHPPIFRRKGQFGTENSPSVADGGPSVVQCSAHIGRVGCAHGGEERETDEGLHGLVSFEFGLSRLLAASQQGDDPQAPESVAANGVSVSLRNTASTTAPNLFSRPKWSAEQSSRTMGWSFSNGNRSRVGVREWDSGLLPMKCSMHVCDACLSNC